MFNLILGFHIVCGTIGLILGPIVMFVKKGKGFHTQLGNMYHWNMLLICISAFALAILHWEKSWFFIFISVFSYWNAFKGYRAAKLKNEGWLVRHVSGMLGSYIALVTAIMVVNSQSIPVLNQLPVLLVWVLPTVIGTPFILSLKRKLQLISS